MVRWISLVLLLLATPVGGSGAAEPDVQGVEPEGGGSPTRPAEPAPIGLDRLLKVPDRPFSGRDLRGGRDRTAWSAEFEAARQEVRTLEVRLAETQEELRAIAPDDWAFTPTGAGTPTDPEVLKLRSAIRRDRQSLDAARSRLRDLEVEASLAGVPDSWVEPPVED